MQQRVFLLLIYDNQQPNLKDTENEKGKRSEICCPDDGLNGKFSVCYSMPHELSLDTPEATRKDSCVFSSTIVASVQKVIRFSLILLLCYVNTVSVV